MSGRRVDTLRRALIWAAPFLIALAGYLVALRQMQPPFTADEPHYALEAFSIAYDGDVDLENDYADIARVRAATDGQTTTLQPHAYHYTSGGPLSSMHHVGLPLLLAPAARISMTVKALQLEMVLLAAIAAQLLFSILAKVVPGNGLLRWASWAVVVFSLPVLGYSSRLYPELPAALLVLGVVRILLSDRLRWWQLLVAGVLIGCLPWLHVRFGVLSAGLLLAVVLRLVELRDRIGAKGIALGAATVAGVLVISLGVMSLAFEHWYGTHSLTVQLHTTNQIVRAPAPGAEPAVTSDAPQASILNFVSFSDVVPGVLRALYSSRNGWLPFVPVGLLAVAGAFALAVRARWWVALGVLVALGYAAEIASTGVLPAYSLPGRYELVFLPLIAVPLAMVLTAVRWTRWLFWPLAVVGAVITLFGMTHAGGLVPFTPGTARADIGAANVLLRPWPTVSRERADPSPPTYTFGICSGAAPAGTVDGCGPDGTVTVPEGRAGTVWASAQRELPDSDYSFAFNLERPAEPAPAGGQAARLEVVSGDAVVSALNVDVDSIPQGDYRTFIQSVRVPEGTPIGARVQTTGRVALRVQAVVARSNLSPLTGLGAVPGRYPDLGAVLAWTAVLLALAAAIAVTLPPRQGRLSRNAGGL